MVVTTAAIERKRKSRGCGHATNEVGAPSPQRTAESTIPMVKKTSTAARSHCQKSEAHPRTKAPKQTRSRAVLKPAERRRPPSAIRAAIRKKRYRLEGGELSVKHRRGPT